MMLPSAFKWGMSLWPGFPAAWNSGSVGGMFLALLFVVGLQWAWIGTFVWPAWLTSWESQVLWWTLGFSVVGSIIYQTLYVAWLGGNRVAGCTDAVLHQAQAYYLQGSYFEAEELLVPYVSSGEWDVEAGLWLASIYRRTGRLEAAEVLLKTVESFERGGVWAEEISQERRKIKDIRRNKRVESL